MNDSPPSHAACLQTTMDAHPPSRAACLQTTGGTPGLQKQNHLILVLVFQKPCRI